MSIPGYDADLFTDDALEDPYRHLRAMRDAGPIVWLEAHGMYAATRYAEVRSILDDHTTYVSGQGVALNDVINSLGRGTTLMSDGDDHRTQRDIIGRPLTPRALADLRPAAQAIADALADRLVERRHFDAVTDFAEILPTTWVPDLLGWPADGREHLVDWAAAQFDGLGPLNDRAVAASDGILAMSAYAQQLAEMKLPEHCFGAGIQRAADRGEIERERCPMLFIDYLAPSLDTTISAIGNAVWLFATHPDQWLLLREEPDRVKAAFNEVLRIESPISCFTRVARVATTVGGFDVPAGSRVMVSFASANRDERRWDEPDRFDIMRESAGHLAFGHGEHACVGMGLARLEGAAVLSALVERIGTIELDGTPVRKRNNLIRSFRSLPVTVTPKVLA
ncbi:MAG TPA: cytochrome P450 [Acidimicrobiales bacterium]|nr:cytochrome P450 [Acidimicrobiales bacterium]